MSLMNIALGLCWAASITGVLVRVLTQRSRWELMLWLPPAVIFGPIGALLYFLDAAAQARSIPPAARPKKTVDSRAMPRPAAPTEILRPALYLYVRHGVDAGTAIPLPPAGAILIRRRAPGERGHSGQLLLGDPAVSRTVHCLIRVDGYAMSAEDVSTNGTIVDGRRIHQGQTTLGVGSVLRLGATTLVVQDGTTVGNTQTMTL